MNSLTLYASTEPADPKNRFVQLVTMIFYELITQKNSPLLSTLCRANQVNFTPKNFRLEPSQATFAKPSSADLFLILYGLNVAATENLDSVCKVFDEHAGKQFPTQTLQDMCEFCLSTLDDALAKFTAAEDDSHVLKALADERRASDEKIIDEIKSLQLSLQDELRTIAQIRDGLDFAAQREPIRQLIELFDKLNEILSRHPLPDTQKGYGELVRRCKSFLRYVEQSLAMLGAEFINETNVPVNLNLHETSERPTDRATVTKILRVGFAYKGQVIRRAQVEFVGGGGAS